MLRYANAQSAQLHSLCRLAAAAIAGTVGGILCFLVFGEAADPDTFRSLYCVPRAFSSYAGAGAYLSYLSYFSGWFSHLSVWLFAAFFCAFTVYPGICTFALCFLRGFFAGFGVCALGGRFSLFFLLYAAAECAFLCVVCSLSAKSISYAHRRARFAKEKSTPPYRDPVWMKGDLLPLLTGLLVSLAALLSGLLALSGVCSFFV